MWCSKCSISIPLTSLGPFLMPSNMEKVFYTLKQNICLLLCCIFLFPFTSTFLKKQMLYTFILYFFLVIPSLTYCALAPTFIILLKLFIRFQKPLLCQIQRLTESSRSRSFLIWPSYLLNFCSNTVFYQDCD